MSLSDIVYLIFIVVVVFHTTTINYNIMKPIKSKWGKILDFTCHTCVEISLSFFFYVDIMDWRRSPSPSMDVYFIQRPCWGDS